MGVRRRILSAVQWAAFAWGFLMPPRRPPEPPDHYYELDVLPVERALIRDALRAYVRSGTEQVRKDLIDKIETATRIDLPLGPAIDWPAVDAECARSRRSLADLIWDEARGREPGCGP